MFFTQEDYKKIEDYLKNKSIRDTNFPISLPLTGREEIPIIQNNRNVKVILTEILKLFRTSNFINIAEIGNSSTDRYTLEEAINIVPKPSRIEGCIITFINSEDNDWKLYQFLGKSIDDWYDLEMWRDILAEPTNHFKGYFENEELLYNNVLRPEIGDYAFVGLTLKDAVIYKCRNRWVWSKTADPALDYVKIVIDGNVTVGSNGNWFNNNEDTGIKAEGPAGKDAPKIASMTLTRGEDGQIVSGVCIFDDRTSINITIN